MAAAVLLALASLWPAVAAGQDSTPSIRSDARYIPSPGMKIAAVELVVPGGLNTDDIMKLLDLRTGDVFSPDAVRKSVKLLYQTGQFSDIAVYAVRSDRGLVMVIELKPRLIIENIRISGNSNMSDLEIIRAMKVDRHDELIPSAVPQMETDIYRRYEQAGFKSASVSVTPIRKGATVRHDLEVKIVEGEPIRVAGVQFDGPAHFPAEILMEEAGLKAGERLDMDGIGKKVAKLREFYRRHDFPFAWVGKPSVRGGLNAVVVIPVDCGERTLFEFAGQRITSRKDLKKVVREAMERRDRPTASYLAGELRSYLVDKGFEKAAVKVGVSVDREKKQRTMIFRIDEGPQLRVRALQFKGNQGVQSDDLEDCVEAFIADYRPPGSVIEPVDTPAVDSGLLDDERGYDYRATARRSLEHDPSKFFVKDTFEKAAQSMVEYYRGLGYQDISVDSPQFEYSREGGHVTVTYRVHEGPRTAVTAVKFEGNKGLSTFFLSFKVRQIIGEYLDLYKVEEARLKLQKLYGEEGYVYASIDDNVKFQDDRKKAVVVFKIDEGVKVRVGRIVLQGNDHTTERVLLGNLTFKPGSVFKSSDQTDSQYKLMKAQIFQNASVGLLDPDEMAAVKDVVISVKERDPQFIQVSGGLSTGDGVRASIEYGHSNLGGTALGFNARLKLGYQVFAYVPGVLDTDYAQEIRSMSFWNALAREVGASFNMPRVYGLPFDMAATLDLVDDRVINRAYSRDRIAATPGIEIKLLKPLSLMIAYSVEYVYFVRAKDVAVNTLTPNQQVTYLQIPNGVRWVGALRPTLALDLRDDRFNPHKGMYLSVGLDYSRQLSGSRMRTRVMYDPFELPSAKFDVVQMQDPIVNYLKLSSSASFYIPTSRRTTLALLIGGGNIFMLSQDAAATPDAVFYMGGRDSLRGIAEKAMFPADISNESKILPNGQWAVSPGGNTYILYRAEFRFPIYGGFDGGLFVEAGNLWLNARDMRPWDVRPCAGFGLRYLTPVGPLSLDIGFNLLPDTGTWVDYSTNPPTQRERREPSAAWGFSVGLF
ncbi:MAG: POTRA domain-containing protein [Myxococcota bacterium]|jgi:outer membrane protein assembly factor BamA